MRMAHFVRNTYNWLSIPRLTVIMSVKHSPTSASKIVVSHSHYPLQVQSNFTYQAI